MYCCTSVRVVSRKKEYVDVQTAVIFFSDLGGESYPSSSVNFRLTSATAVPASIYRRTQIECDRFFYKAFTALRNHFLSLNGMPLLRMRTPNSRFHLFYCVFRRHCYRAIILCA